MHRARGVRFGDVERAEIMPVILNLRPGGHSKAHIGEYFGKLVHHLAYGMHRTLRRGRRGQCHIKPLGGKTRVERFGFERCFARRNRGRHGFAKAVDRRALHLTLVRRHLAKRFEQRRNTALLAKCRDANGFERVERCGSHDLRLKPSVN